MKYQLPAEKFDGGWNSKTQDINVPLDQLTQAEQVWYDDYGAFKTRDGYSKLNTASLGSAAVDGVFSYKPSTMSAQLVAVCNGRAAVATGVATTFNDIASSVTVWTADTPIEMVQQNELLFFSNGNVKPYKFNGTEFTQMGVSAPSTVLTAATNATAGNLTGSYTWVYTGVNSYLAESDYGSATVTFAAVGESVKVGSIPTAPVSAGVEYYKIYRNTAGVEGAYWYVTDVTNGVTSFTDNIADSSLETQAPTDQGMPRFFKFMLASSGRMWGAGDANKDYLWFSNINQPEEVPANNFIRVGRGDGLDISGIAELNGNIVISKSDYSGRTAVYELQIGDPTTNSDPSNWYLKKTGDGVGSDSHRAMINYSNVITMFNHDGIYAYTNGGALQTISETEKGAFIADSLSENIENEIVDLESGYYNIAAAVDWENRIYFAATPDSFTKNYRIFVFDYVRLNKSDTIGGSWSLWSPFPVSQFVKHDDNLYFAGNGYSGSFEGNVFKMFDGDTDKGSVINPITETAPFKGKKGHESNWKDFRWIYVTADAVSYTIKIEVYVDGSYTADYEIDLTGSGTQTHKLRLATEQGRYIQFRFKKDSVSDAFKMTIRKIELVYNLRGLRN